MIDTNKELNNPNEREDERVLSFEGLEDAIGYRFADRSLLEHALTHSSFVNETGGSKEDSNERLEFLGDAVLELASSIRLYGERPTDSEGVLSKTRARLVCESALAKKAERIGLGQRLILGKGEEKTGGRKRPSITSDALEALIGAVYLDGGFEAARALVDRIILDDLSEQNFEDYKTELQERVQKMGHADVHYELREESGPDHAKSFTMAVLLGDKEIALGKGRSKKAAQQLAAKTALERLSEDQE